MKKMMRKLNNLHILTRIAIETEIFKIFKLIIKNQQVNKINISIIIR